MSPRPFAVIPRISVNAHGWRYLRWGRGLRRIGDAPPPPPQRAPRRFTVLELGVVALACWVLLASGVTPLLRHMVGGWP